MIPVILMIIIILLIWYANHYAAIGIAVVAFLIALKKEDAEVKNLLNSISAGVGIIFLVDSLYGLSSGEYYQLFFIAIELYIILEFGLRRWAVDRIEDIKKLKWFIFQYKDYVIRYSGHEYIVENMKTSEKTRQKISGILHYLDFHS